MIRTSVLCGRGDPSLSNSPLWRTRRSLAWTSRGSSAISSRKSVPLSAISNRPDRALQRAGEGPALVAEQLALDERRRQRGAVDGDDRPVAPAAAVVEGPRDEVLARPRLAEEEDGRVGRGHLLDLAQHAAESGAAADDRLEAVEVPHLAVQDHVLRLHAILQLPDLDEALLERGLRRFELRHVGVYDDGAGVGRQGNGMDEVVPNPGRPGVRDRPLERRVAALDHRADALDDTARAGVGRHGRAGERGQVVHPVRDLRGGVGGETLPGRLVHRDEPPVAVEEHDLARQGAEDGAVQLLGDANARLGGVAVPCVRDDAGQQLQAGQEARRPGPRFVEARDPECPDDLLADDERQHGVGLEPAPADELPLRDRLRRQLVRHEVEHDGAAPGELRGVPRQGGAEVPTSLVGRDPGPGIRVLENQRAPVGGEERHAAAIDLQHLGEPGQRTVDLGRDVLRGPRQEA